MAVDQEDIDAVRALNERAEDFVPETPPSGDPMFDAKQTMHTQNLKWQAEDRKRKADESEARLVAQMAAVLWAGDLATNTRIGGSTVKDARALLTEARKQCRSS